MVSVSIETMFAAHSLFPLGPRAAPSGIGKSVAPPPWRITRTGLDGDRQGDLVNHGGEEKALHHYPRDHYARWFGEEPALAAALAEAPAFGENISTFGITEQDVCVGDVFALGAARLQVSQGRQPCWKLNERFQRKDMARRVQDSGRTGWYYRVLGEGAVQPGDRLELIERPLPDWPVLRLNELLYRRMLDFDALEQMTQLPQLAAPWRELASRRLLRRKVEDWSSRLEGA
ncbi:MULTISPECIES: MOSC domain-containing protein [Methylosinus]|uniref:MOSC domain-containing protein n=1 Tax=Methylosinus trichosporium (strain ATCC 35070 / NCIMB 11131 / UNIQEM 75 / OB3b) TaxID=595536 RepID=A0A2D2D314_METT3|nr:MULTISPECIES: MOSC domain-containing protein [Methylosinus]ATQ69383.1 MOSC domain-containing protein [Methylosinus trichosporium OB3b]OBS52897.1 molybdenum cofactor sulfurase [Methylosinus sp. 3S-1]